MLKEYNVRTVNYFYIALCLFAASLPLSQALVSIFAYLLLFISIVDDSWNNKVSRIKKHKNLLLIVGIYIIYVVSALSSGSLSNSFYDLRKTLFYLIIPIAIVMGRDISKQQFYYLLTIYITAVIVSIIIGLFKWIYLIDNSIFSIHDVTFVDHIQFSFQLIFAFWASLYLYKCFKCNYSWIFILTASFSLFFLFLQQSLVGLISFIATVVYILIFAINKLRLRNKWIIYLSILIIGLLPLVYIVYSINRFYDVKKVDENIIERKTALGNYYQHNFHNKLLENGNYVYLYINEQELKSNWNRRSSLPYDSVDANGYKVKSTLIRYMTSKGLTKDAEGVAHLSQNDITNIENGVANIIYTKSKYSLYPRIYQTIWEYDVFIKTGNANNKSFAQRLVFWQAAIHIIQNHPYFGVGTCCWQTAFNNYYKEMNPELDAAYYASSHNQYLNYLVKFGIIGFILIMILIFLPVIKSKIYINPLFMVFIISLLIGNFGDSNFETHMTGAFFIFFYSTFIKMKLSDIY